MDGVVAESKRHSPVPPFQRMAVTVVADRRQPASPVSETVALWDYENSMASRPRQEKGDV